MDSHEFRDLDIDKCPECHGLWLDSHEFDYLTSERDIYDDDSVPREFRRKPLPEEEGYMRCPRCNAFMTRQNFGTISGVLIDRCHDHGVWLDAGELEHLRAFIASGGLEKAQNKYIRENRAEIRRLAGRLSDVEFLDHALHKWQLKYWMYKRR
jgi:Zn-finger nucleic acid-binding protein